MNFVLASCQLPGNFPTKSGTLRFCPPPNELAGCVYIARRYGPSEGLQVYETKLGGSRVSPCSQAISRTECNTWGAQEFGRRHVLFFLSLMSRASFIMGAVPSVYMRAGLARTGSPSCDDARPISVTPASSSFNYLPSPLSPTSSSASPYNHPPSPTLRCVSRSTVPGEPAQPHPMIKPLLLTGLAAAATAQTTNTSSQACVSGNAVHMIVARASLEPPGFGVLANISTRVMEQLPGSNAEAVVYPATLDGYQNSEGQGVAAMTQLVNSYAQACPSSKVVLMGYSQGAQVTADTVCGSTISGFAQTQAISTAVLDKVSAIMLMGDPTHAVNQPYDQGTSTKAGVSRPSSSNR